MFRLHSPYEPTGDQPQAAKKLIGSLNKNAKYQTLLGVTGSGKTFTMAQIIGRLNRPALVISHNKTLAAQLFQEFKEFFPKNPVHYFVSYYDYYQPEAYLPATDTYIAKDAKINEFIDKLRHASTQTALTEEQFVIVSSVSCIYGLGDPKEYEKMSFILKEGTTIKRQELLKQLVNLQYERKDFLTEEEKAGSYGVKGETIKIISPDGQSATTIEMSGNAIENLKINGKKAKQVVFFPSKHFVTPKQKLEIAIANIRQELAERIKELEKAGKKFEAERLKERTNLDLEMLNESGYCPGIENYSRHLSFRKSGEPPFTLLDYLPKETIIFIDESHISVPQIKGMYLGDQARKKVLAEHGFRLPSALDNRPLTLKEFLEKTGQIVFVSATPGIFEFKHSSQAIAEQLIRPTGLLDPNIEIKPARGQIQDLIEEIKKSALKKERVLVVTLTKRLAEDISQHFQDQNIKTEYLHSEVKTLERPEILKRLRQGDFDVLVGINLLREGLDLPEVGLVAILDADKEGFLRNYTTLIQTIGRASRHPQGRAILYADSITQSMKKAVEETERRRNYQFSHNKKFNITPRPIIKAIRPTFFESQKAEKFNIPKNKLGRLRLKKELKEEMKEFAKSLQFEKAAEIRDMIKQLE